MSPQREPLFGLNIRGWAVLAKYPPGAKQKFRNLTDAGSTTRSSFECMSFSNNTFDLSWPKRVETAVSVALCLFQACSSSTTPLFLGAVWRTSITVNLRGKGVKCNTRLLQHSRNCCWILKAVQDLVLVQQLATSLALPQSDA